MGVGKTIQAVAVCAAYRDNWPVLIVCPTSLKFNWRSEILKWLGEDGVTSSMIQVINTSKDTIYKAVQFVICRDFLFLGLMLYEYWWVGFCEGIDLGLWFARFL